MTDNQPSNSPPQPFDVFLSHNSQDKPAVEAIACRLEDEAGMKVWLDKWNLSPGDAWQEKLEEALDQSAACVVFIGPTGIGPWHNQEMRVALDQRVRQDGFRVVPVLLPGATMPERGQLPKFLSTLSWADFRQGSGINEDAFHSLVCGIRGLSPGRRGISFSTAIENPYRGLEVFDEQHARLFFGREALTQHLIEALRNRHFLGVVGASGSGKSSLARAGLLSQLRKGALPGSQDWRYVVFKPGAHPLESLACSLVNPTEIADAQGMIERLRSDESTLHLHARLALRDAAEDVCLLLLIDQFEEVFTRCPNSPEGRAEQTSFIENLRYAATSEDSRAVIVITMRADFAHRAAEFSSLAKLLSHNQFIVSPMEPRELRSAIAEPAGLAGADFESGLVERILTDVGQEPGNLPLLEYALSELFRQRRSDNVMTAQGYDQIGGVQGAIAKKADDLFASFDEGQKQIVRRVLLRLTQPGAGALDTRRRALLAEMWANDEERPQVERVLRSLTDARLLTTGSEATGEPQVEVAHEALIRGWPRLGQWINEDREGLLLQHRIAEDAREWQSKERSDDYLYHGARLARALEWQQKNLERLNQLENEFLEASAARESQLEKEERERQQRELKRQQQEEGERVRRELAHAQALVEAQKQTLESAYVLAYRLNNDLGLVNTRVNDIRGFLAEEQISSTVVDATLDNILSDVSRVLHMSRGLKTMAARSQEVGKPVAPTDYLSVNALLEEAKLASPIPPSNIELSWEATDESVKVKVVTGQIIEILSTLIFNAIEAMPDGGQIAVKAFKSDEDVCIEVTDDGPGIYPANQKEIFNLFVSTKNSSGFGLWNARHYARTNGGDLMIKSEPGKGSTFTLSLPLSIPEMDIRNG